MISCAVAKRGDEGIIILDKCKYTLFSCSLKRWKILSKLHGISSTIWSDRIESVKPFVAHLPGVELALEDLLKLNLTPKTRNEIHEIYMLCRFFHLHHNVSRVAQYTSPYWLLQQSHSSLWCDYRYGSCKHRKLIICTTRGFVKQLESNVEWS